MEQRLGYRPYHDTRRYRNKHPRRVRWVYYVQDLTENHHLDERSWHEGNKRYRTAALSPERKRFRSGASETEFESYEIDDLVDCSPQPGADEESPISQLNNSCLLALFSFLDFRERLVVSLVCRKWRQVCSILWNQEEILDFTKRSLKKLVTNYNVTVPTFLRLCPNVTEVTAFVGGGTKVITTIAQCCSKLERLTIQHSCSMDCRMNLLVNVAQRCPNLRSLTLTAPPENCGAMHCRKAFLAEFLTSASNLRHLRIEGNIKEKGNWLRKAKVLKSLHLEKFAFHPNDLVAFLEKHGEDLSALTITPTFRLGNYFLGSILSLTPHLRELNLSDERFSFSRKGGLRKVAEMGKLTKLGLGKNPQVSDKLLIMIARGCPMLTHLDLSETGQITPFLTPRGVQNLVYCDNLISLNLSSTNYINLKLLKGMTRCLNGLKELFLRFIPLTDRECIEIIRQGYILELLDISFNQVVTNKTFDFACQIMRDNPYRPKIDIMMIGCSNVSRRFPDSEISEKIYFDLSFEDE